MAIHGLKDRDKTGPIIGLDHVIIGVKDLEGAREDYNRLGFVNAPLGDHQGRATANYCLMFPDTYLELLGVNQPDLDSGSLVENLERRGEGLQRVALGTPDADAAKEQLGKHGVRTEDVRDLARPSKEPEGVVRFRNLFIPADETAGLLLFLCGHKTPELMRTPAWMEHPNGARSFAGATAIVDDVDATLAALARLFGEQYVLRTSYGAEIQTDRGTISVTKRDTFEGRHPGAATPDLPLPAWHALDIGVADVTATAKYLEEAGIPVERPAKGIVRVGPDHARGVLMEFVQAS